MKVFPLLLLFGLLPELTHAQQANIRLEPVTRIGCLDCRGPALFGGIQALSMASGRVHVADVTAPFIRVFDTSGRHLTSFGGKGNGPGELQLPIFIGPRTGNALEIYDMRQMRFTRFGATGDPEGTRSIQGFAALAASAPGARETFVLTTDFRTADQPLLRLTDDAREPATFLTLRADFPKVLEDGLPRTPSIAVRSGEIAIGDGVAEYRIRRYDANGRIIGDIVRDVAQPKKSPDEIAEEKARAQRNIARMRAMARAEGGTPTEYEPRPLRNHFSMGALAYDEKGRLWVRTERGGLNTTVFDVFEGNRRLGEVRVAARLGIFALADGLLAARLIDEDEVEYVAIYRVR